MSNSPGDSCLRQSSSLFATLGTRTFCSRRPESENCTIVTSPGSPFAIAASISRGLCSDHSAAPAIAENEIPRKARRLTLTDEPSSSSSESNISLLNLLRYRQNALLSRIELGELLPQVGHFGCIVVDNVELIGMTRRIVLVISLCGIECLQGHNLS